MPATTPTAQIEAPPAAPPVSDAAIAAKTGRDWTAWCAVLDAIHDDAFRAAWLADSACTVRRSLPHRTVRLRLGDGTSVAVYLVLKGDQKTQVTVEHSGLPDAEQVERLRTDWKARLDALARLLAAERSVQSPGA